MLLVAFGWIYVVLMVAIVQAMSDNGTVLGAVLTFAFYGLLPVGILVYLMLSPARRRAQRIAEAAARAAAEGVEQASAAAVDPDGGRHAAGDLVAAERKES